MEQLTTDGYALCSGWHGHIKMSVKLCPELVVKKINANLSGLAVTCCCFEWPPSCEQLFVQDQMFALAFV